MFGEVEFIMVVMLGPVEFPLLVMFGAMMSVGEKSAIVVVSIHHCNHKYTPW